MDNLGLVVILTVGFTLAGILGFISRSMRLSPILGYLLAGYMIGPFFPGFVADLKIAEQLAEIGVMLMMFGVGLHFKWQDLVNVKNIAIPGALLQTLSTTIITGWLVHIGGWSWSSGIIIGLSIGVASTVVLMRTLSDKNILSSREGHIAIGWLIVEDILTVIVLILLPTIISFMHGDDIAVHDVALSILIIAGKFLVLAALMFTVGHKIATYVLLKIAQTRSHELFTLTILALIFVIASGSSIVFGASIALGAFIAGMVIGQTEVRHQASANASGLKDIFVVLFFLSVGMLFNPMAIIDHPFLFTCLLGIVLIFKPLVALIIMLTMRYSFQSSLIVALSLAQIGEFSFILAEEALKLNILPDEGFDIIVACAIISISVNPLLLIIADYFTNYLKQSTTTSTSLQSMQPIVPTSSLKVIIIGFGYIGQRVADDLKKIDVIPVIIDSNIDTILELIKKNEEAIYGDASQVKILEVGQIKTASLLIITVPELSVTIDIIRAVRELNTNIQIYARARYFHERNILQNLRVDKIFSDEEEVGKAVTKALQIFPFYGLTT